jgi:hypothetical protein
LLHEELLAFHFYISGEAKLVRLKGKRIMHAIFTCGGGAPLGFTYLYRGKNCSPLISLKIVKLVDF